MNEIGPTIDVVGAAGRYRDHLNEESGPCYITPSLRMTLSGTSKNNTDELIEELRCIDRQQKVGSSSVRDKLPQLSESALGDLEKAVVALTSSCEGLKEGIGEDYLRLKTLLIEGRKTIACRDENLKELTEAIPNLDASYTALRDALKLNYELQESINILSTYDTAAKLTSTAVEELAASLKRDLMN